MEGKVCTLQGETISSPSILNASRLTKTRGKSGSMLQICCIQEIPSTALNPDPQIEEILHQFQEVFEGPKELPPNWTQDHRIPLIKGAQPVFIWPYRYPHYQKNEIEKLVKEILCSGIIRPSQSPFSSSVLLVWKDDGSWRFCIDYRPLNQVTIKGKFPIPIIEELLDELHGASIFSKLDQG